MKIREGTSYHHMEEDMEHDMEPAWCRGSKGLWRRTGGRGLGFGVLGVKSSGA